jgi:predicted regulator of Ras-like GTPase activity (Roadblock/LC7/MglB family)
MTQERAMPADGFPTTDTSAPERLSGLLTQLVNKTPGVTQALLASGDGLKMAWTDQPLDDADTLAAVVSGLYSLGRQQFHKSPGGVRQVVIEHDAGSLFVMSASGPAVGTTMLAVVTSPKADPGQVGYEMDQFIKGLAEHLVIEARETKIQAQGL